MKKIILDKFLKKSNIQIIGISIQTAEIFGEIQNQLKAKGSPIPINDVWIASQTIETGSKLISYDGHFKEVLGLRIWDGLRPR